jgi:Protein of unknown function (DUF3800)
MKYDVFVDESCHLEHDGISVMSIGYIKVPRLAYEELKSGYRTIKEEFGIESEIKWSKFSKLRLPFYKKLVDFFFDTPLEFRCVLVKYKERLNHEDFNRGSHDNFYYKMTYYLLRPNPPGLEYRVFLDIKDTRGREKLQKIDEVFHNYHHGDSPFVKFQHLHSHDNDFFQLADFFIGAITYKCRWVKNEVPINLAKQDFISYLESKSGFTLNEGTAPWETKFNIFDHQPKNQL